MAIIPFGPWTPDVADYANPGVLTAKNVFPSASGYLPVKSLVAATSALTARPRGAIQARDDDGNVFQYAGDASKLYQNSSNVWTDVSLSGGYSTADEENWSLVAWKNKMLATNFSDNPQSITFGGANFANLTTALKARHITTIRDFVVMANTFDATDGAVPSRVRWSAFDDEADWTVSASTLSDFQDLKNAAVVQIHGGEFGVILQGNSIWRQTFVGAPVVFQFDEVLPGVGSIHARASTRDKNTVYFLSNQGFFALVNGTEVNPIGANRVDRFVLDDLDQSNLHRLSTVVDPKTHRVFWAYPGADNIGGRPNRIAVYDRSLDRWSLIEKDVELLWRGGGTGFTLDSLDDFGLGAELVSNGDFGTDTVWTKGTGWAIAAGTATHTAGVGQAGDLSQTVSITNGTYYRLEFDVSGRTAGTLTPKVGGTSGTAISADTTDEKETIRAGAGTSATFSADDDFDGSVDNVSLKEVTSIDDLPFSLDSNAYVGGAFELAAFDGDFKSGFFTGSNMAAQIVSKELEIHSGHVTHLNAFRSLVDRGTVTAKIGTRDRQSDAVSFGSALTQSASGRFTKRSTARYHRFQFDLSGGWTDAIGLQIEPREAKKGERRA